MKQDSLGDRMKNYENCFRFKLPKRIPKILRIDGKAFHTALRFAEKPYDQGVMTDMMAATSVLLHEIGGTARLAYIQSDEISILLNDALTIYTSAWFDNNLQKMCSVAAGIVSANFSHYKHLRDKATGRHMADATFDARIFLMPEDEIVNYFIWRQQDASRNSIQQYARNFFSHKECDNKNSGELQDMMMDKHNFNWNDAPVWTKRGVVMAPYTNVEPYPIDWCPPIFTADREYITKRYNVNETTDPNSHLLETPVVG